MSDKSSSAKYTVKPVEIQILQQPVRNLGPEIYFPDVGVVGNHFIASNSEKWSDLGIEPRLIYGGEENFAYIDLGSRADLVLRVENPNSDMLDALTFRRNIGGPGFSRTSKRNYSLEGVVGGEDLHLSSEISYAERRNPEGFICGARMEATHSRLDRQRGWVFMENLLGPEVRYSGPEV